MITGIRSERLLPLTRIALFVMFSMHVSLYYFLEIYDRDKRVERVRELLRELPEENKSILLILIQHLNR